MKKWSRKYTMSIIIKTNAYYTHDVESNHLNTKQLQKLNYEYAITLQRGLIMWGNHRIITKVRKAPWKYISADFFQVLLAAYYNTIRWN